MTTASTKVNTSLFDQLLHHNRDIMPACVATSFPRISNDVYRRESSRDEQEQSSESSSPDTPKYEQTTFQFSRNFSENVLGKALAFAGLPKKDETVPSSTLKSKMTDSRNNDLSNSDDEIENQTFQSSPTMGSPKEEAPNSVSSPKSAIMNHSLKKRFLQNAGSDVTVNIMTSPSHTPSKNDKEASNPEMSSEILRMMYASFGGTNNINTFNPFINHKDLPNQYSNPDTGVTSQNFDEQNHSPQQERRKTEEGENGTVLSRQNTQGSSNFGCGLSEHQESTKEKTLTKEKCSSTHTHREKNPRENSSRKRKHEDKKRTTAAEFQSTMDDIRYHSSSSSPVGNTKRKRFSSSESSDSQPIYPHGNMNNFYKQNSPWLPFVNPLFCPPNMFGSLGASSSGCSIPNYPHPNPLMMGSNPYLTNPVMLRDMMTSAGATGLLPFLHNPSFYPSLPGAVSPRQLQAFHQLQSLMLYQNPSLFPTNGYPFSPGVLPLSQPHMKPVVNQLNSSGQPLDKRPNDQSKSVTPEKIVLREKHHSKKRTNSSNDQSVFSKNRTLEKHHSKQESGKLPPIQNQKHPMPGKMFNPSPSKREDLPKVNFNKLHHRLPKSPRKRFEQTETTCSKAKMLLKCDSKTSAISLGTPSIDETEESEKFRRDSSSPTTPGSKLPSYKNLTRERRLVANARERTRVHTISSAFDELRAQIPSYSCNQKLSKLAILRIACEYIRTLSVLVGCDDSMSFSQGVEQCTRVLQSESRARSRRKNNKAQIEWEMVNYERRKSRDETEPLTPSISPRQSDDRHSSPLNDTCKYSENFQNTSFNDSVEMVNDDVADHANDDLTENDNDIVDVESVDDDLPSDNQTQADG